MGNELIPLSPFNFNGFQAGCDFIIQEQSVLQAKRSLSEMEFPGENPFASSAEHGKQILQQEEARFTNFMFEEFNIDSALQPAQPIQETTALKKAFFGSEVAENIKQAPVSSSLSSLELLSNYGGRFKRLKGPNMSKESSVLPGRPQKLSTEDIIRVAAARYVQFAASNYDDYFMPLHPYGFALKGFSEEETRDIELAQCFLAAAEKVGCQQFESASRLLQHCQWNTPANPNAVQRVIYHFTQALRERIAKGRGILTLGSEKNLEEELCKNMDPRVSILVNERVPFGRVIQFTGIQAIVENVASETKIHLIDFEIRLGSQYSALMQALAERHQRPVELLKITAIGYTGISEPQLEETGKRLARFAESLNLPFSYRTVLVADITQLKKEQFQIEDDEAVAVFDHLALRTMVSKPECLENLMDVIKDIKPSIMVVLELDANHNSASFVNRFVEALFFYSAFFDCVETCLKQEEEARMTIEAILREGIRNIVAMEGRERTVRNVKIDVWRKFFARKRMIEIGFSESSVYQASLLMKEFGCGNHCTLDKNGKSLLLGWKGTPIHSISA